MHCILQFDFAHDRIVCVFEVVIIYQSQHTFGRIFGSLCLWLYKVAIVAIMNLVVRFLAITSTSRQSEYTPSRIHGLHGVGQLDRKSIFCQSAVSLHAFFRHDLPPHSSKQRFCPANFSLRLIFFVSLLCCRQFLAQLGLGQNRLGINLCLSFRAS